MTKKRVRWTLVVVVLGIVVLGGIWWVRMTMVSVQAQSTCYTTEEVSSGCADSNQCLYIYQDGVYERDTCSSSHMGHPCGSDITNILPAWHTLGGAFVGSKVGVVCTGPSPTPTIGSSDLNVDGRVDLYDLNMLMRYYGNSGSPGTVGDIYLDGHVDAKDMIILLMNL